MSKSEGNFALSETFLVTKKTLLLAERTLRITISAYQWPKQTLSADITLTVIAAPKDYSATTAAVLRLPAEVIYGTDSKTSGKYESFTHQNILI